MTELNTPWKSGPYDARYIFDNKSEVIAYVSSDLSVALNQAHVIAAAPELLEACKAALEWRGLDGDGISDPVRVQLMQAIKKAEKGQ